MFNRKARRIKELQKTVELLQQTVRESSINLSDKNNTIAILRKEMEELNTKIAKLEFECSNLKNTVKNATKKLGVTIRINKKLKKENTMLEETVNHTKEVNRNRQRRFREAHKND